MPELHEHAFEHLSFELPNVLGWMPWVLMPLLECFDMLGHFA